MSKTEKTSIEFSDLNVTLSLDTDNFPEELKTPLSQTYDPESTYAMSGVAVGEALKPVYDKISTVLGGVDQTYSPRSASAQSGIAVKQAIDDVENRIKEFDNALEGCNSAAIMAREAANRAAASSVSAQKSASTAVFAKSDLETARDTAVSAATTATDAASAASSVKSYLETARDTAVSAATTATDAAAAAATSETNATAAATAATQQAEAAAASATQADTDARACALFVPRAEAAQQAAADSATAAAASETAAAASATAAAASAASIDVFGTAAQIAAGTANMEAGIIVTGRRSNGRYRVCAVKNYGSVNAKCDYLICQGENAEATDVSKCIFSETCESLKVTVPCFVSQEAFVHLPNIVTLGAIVFGNYTKVLTFSDVTNFDKLTKAMDLFYNAGSLTTINWAPGTTFGAVTNAWSMFAQCGSLKSLPDTFTFKSVKEGNGMFRWDGNLRNLPANMKLSSLTNGREMFNGCANLEVEDLARVCLTINDLQALETPKTGTISLPITCKHNGSTVQTKSYLDINHPDILVTLNARGWTVTFA